MAQQKIIDSEINTIVTNTSDTNFHILCIYDGVTINNKPEIQSPIIITIGQDTEYVFDPAIITNVLTDPEGDGLWTFEVVESSRKGKLVFGDNDLEILDGQIIGFLDFNKLKWTPIPGQSGVAYSSIKLRFRGLGAPPRLCSDVVDIIFNVEGINIQPVVSDSCLDVNYKTSTVLATRLFIQDYYDPEANALGRVVIDNPPPAGEGRLLLSGTVVDNTQYPLTVTVGQLNTGQLVYEDTGLIKDEKIINLTFEVFDNVV